MKSKVEVMIVTFHDYPVDFVIVTLIVRQPQLRQTSFMAFLAIP